MTVERTDTFNRNQASSGVSGGTVGTRGRRIWYRILILAVILTWLVLTWVKLRPDDYMDPVTSDSGQEAELSYADLENGYYDDFRQIYLMPGTYQLTIDARTSAETARYEVVDQQTNQVYAEGQYDPGEEYHAVSFSCNSPIHCMVVRSFPGKDSELSIYGYTLEADDAVCSDSRWFIILTLQFLLLLWIGWRRSVRKSRPAFLALTILAAVVSLPFLGSNLPSGHDLSFHLARIESLGYAIRDGQVPERINTAFAGHGNITPILYPELILLQSGFLCARNTTVWFAWKAGMVFLTFLTAYLSYAGARVLLGEKESLLFAFLYTLNPFRLNDIFLRAAAGEAFALAFLPLVFAGMVCLLDNRRDPVKGMILTVMGASGLLSSHILSTMITAAFCLLAMLITLLTHPLRLLKDRKRVKMILLSAGLCIGCSLWFLIPFMEFRGWDFVVANQFVQLDRKTPYLWQAFMNPGSMSAFSTTASTSGEMSYTIGPAMAAAAAAFVLVIVLSKGKRHAGGMVRYGSSALVKTGIISFLFGSLSLYMASNYFPWIWFCDHSFLFRATFGQIQYRWRMMGFAALFYTVCGVIAVYLLKGKLKYLLAAVLSVLCVVSAVEAGTQYYQNGDYSLSKWGHEQYLSPDYILKEIYNRDGQQILGALASGEGPSADDNITVTGWHSEGTEYVVSFTGSGTADSVITVPVLYYGLYRAELYPGDGSDAEGDSGNSTDVKEQSRRYLQISMNQNSQFTDIVVPAGVPHGEIHLVYQERPAWLAGDIVSIIIAAGFVIFCCVYRKR